MTGISESIQCKVCRRSFKEWQMSLITLEYGINSDHYTANQTLDICLECEHTEECFNLGRGMLENRLKVRQRFLDEWYNSRIPPKAKIIDFPNLPIEGVKIEMRLVLGREPLAELEFVMIAKNMDEARERLYIYLEDTCPSLLSTNERGIQLAPYKLVTAQEIHMRVV